VVEGPGSAEALDAGEGRAVVGIGAPLLVDERGGAQGVDANAREALLVGAAGLAVGDVAVPGGDGAPPEEAEAGITVLGIDAERALRQLGLAARVHAGETIGAGGLRGARLPRGPGAARPEDAELGDAALAKLGAVRAVLLLGLTAGVDADKVVGARGLRGARLPRGSGAARPKDAELGDAALVEVGAVGAVLFLGLAAGVDADEVGAASGLWGARLSIEARAAKP